MWEPKEGWDVLTIETLKARYLREGERDWEDICERVAKAIATTEEEYLEFRDSDDQKDFSPEFAHAHERGYQIRAACSLFCYSCGGQYRGDFRCHQNCGPDPENRWRHRV